MCIEIAEGPEDSYESFYICWNLRAGYYNYIKASLFILSKFKDISLLNNYELITTVGLDNVISARANSHYVAYNCLNDVSRRYKGELLNICVLETKSMAVGVALYSLRNPEKVKVSFPFPEKYKENSSSQMGDSWYYQIKI